MSYATEGLTLGFYGFVLKKVETQLPSEKMVSPRSPGARGETTLTDTGEHRLNGFVKLLNGWVNNFGQSLSKFEITLDL